MSGVWRNEKQGLLMQVRGLSVLARGVMSTEGDEMVRVENVWVKVLEGKLRYEDDQAVKLTGLLPKQPGVHLLVVDATQEYRMPKVLPKGYENAFVPEGWRKASVVVRFVAEVVENSR